MAKLALGLDSSTQSLTAVVVDIDNREVVYQKSLDYKLDPRLDKFGINDQYILPPNEADEANQPVAMYIASLDTMFSDIAADFPDAGLKMADICVINTSGQQHGHVLLSRKASEEFASLKENQSFEDVNLNGLLKNSLSLPFARIWRTGCTARQANHVRDAVGGKDKIIELTGSDAPLRFSAFGIRKTGQDYSDAYRQTQIIHQISSFIPAILTGRVDIPLDFGNACGTSLMNYREKQWSEQLIAAVSDGLDGHSEQLAQKLPTLASGKTIVGSISTYFAVKYGFNPTCAIGIGSGDNPQTKILVSGSLLSLGSSFIIMVETDGRSLDKQGSANAMYDAFDRPFMFGCRTNGALRWDNVRADFGIDKSDYTPGEQALAETPAGNRNRIYLWTSEQESLPVFGPCGPIRSGYFEPDFATDYVGIIESSLASVYLHSRGFMKPGKTLYVTGGSTASPEIMRRVAAIWNRNVIGIEGAGAALGAAAGGAYAFLHEQGQKIDTGDFGSSFLNKQASIKPQPEDVAAYHGEQGFLQAYEKVETKHMK